MFWVSLSFSQTISDSLIIEEELYIYYESDKFDIPKKEEVGIYELVRKYFDPEFFFRLDAHTDSDGSDDYNITLSRKRCDGIKQILLTQGIPEDRIDYFSHGEKMLFVEETTSEQKSKNRRATIRIYENKEFISFEGNLSPQSGEEVITGDIYVAYEKHKSSISTDSTGLYKLKLPTNENVELNILAKNHFPIRKKINLKSDSRTDKITFEFKKYTIDNAIRTTIQFKGDKSIVLKKSLSELEYLGLSLLSNPEVCVELEGHINRPNEKPLARDHKDFGLSIARSVEIYNYLVEKGVSDDRLLARGYGNSRMIYPRAGWEKEQSANRRVEVKVMSCDKTASIENDSVPDLSYYQKEEPLAKDFVYENRDSDMSDFPPFVQTELNAQIEYMEYNKQDPEKYSYFELLSMSRRRAEK